MKKLWFAIVLTVLSIVQLSAQKGSDFEGVVKYTVSFEDSQLPPEATAMFKNAQLVVSITPEKQRTDVDMVLQSTSSIIDLKKKQIYTLMDVAGKKYIIKNTEAEAKRESEKAPQPEIKYLDETKEIAGYKCKKAEVTIDGSEMKMVVYYTNEIQNNDLQPVYKGLKGFPLEYSTNMGGMQIKFIAKSISKEKVPDSVFEIPKGYIETTAEDLQRELLKQLGGQ
ncbi:MAG: DUF4412 domain-containing protein [Bacteroidia bacterium]